MDLHYIALRADAPLRQRRFAANVIMIGLIYTNSYAGRVGSNSDSRSNVFVWLVCLA